jgi:riboflavin transporter FmnP
VDQLIASFGEFIPFIKTKLDVVLYNAFPFNLLKGLVITAFTMLVYKRIRPLLKGKHEHVKSRKLSSIYCK